jgi:ADP-heptose:LPS heptosyltransferase
LSKIIEILINEAKLCDKLPDFHDRSVEDVMIHVKFTDGHIHSVYPKGNIAKELTQAAIEDLQIETAKEKKTELPKRIIFHNRQAIGDILMMTCAIRDFKKAFPEIKIKVESTAMHIWDHNPNICQEKWSDVLDAKENTKQIIDQTIKEDKPIRLYIGPSKGTNASNRSDKHFANAYRMSIEDILNVKIPQGPIRPDIYMTEEEYKREPIIKQPYWLITAGEKGDWTCKTFPFQKWQKIIENLPWIFFVQLGSSGHRHPELKGENVINYIGKTENRDTGIRDLFNLFLNCEGSIGLVSFQMHLAAAFNKPCVVIAGAREPVWFTRYPGQRYMASDGCLPCTVKNNDEPTACWFCKLERCSRKDDYYGQDIPHCVSIFSAGDVANEIKRYYDGGRLSQNKILGKSKLVNVVKNSNIKKEETKETGKSEYGMKFGGGSITDKDWDFIKEVIEKYKVETVLEFGAGLSTLLLNSLLDKKPITYEANIGWIKKIKEINKDCDIRKWNGFVFRDSFEKPFDLAFVDGPAGGENREESIKTASKLAKSVIIHDAGRAPERKWQDKYLKDKFYLEAKGGHRCHLWRKIVETKKDDICEKWCEEDPTLDVLSYKKINTALTARFKPVENQDIKDIKEERMTCQTKNKQRILRVLFNGRGEGGAERSTTWIMNRFAELGWRVQYFSPNNTPSGTFRKEGKKEIEFIHIHDINAMRERCDVLFLYTNDWVWDFKLPEVRHAIDSIESKRKVMAINYRLGDVGTQKALWTIGWDKYIFLNSSLENTLINKTSYKTNTKVLPPPTDLTSFLENKINYNGNLKLIRHSSQGDAKYPKDFNSIVERILYRIPGSEIFLMPAPSFLSDSLKASDRVHTFKRNQPEVKKFLTYGNVFWYKLPEGYHDQGPKVIMEAQASGLPVIADNHSGARDRVVGETGLLCDNIEQHIISMEMLMESEERKRMGENAKSHARENYDPENWIKEIIG